MYLYLRTEQLRIYIWVVYLRQPVCDPLAVKRKQIDLWSIGAEAHARRASHGARPGPNEDSGTPSGAKAFPGRHFSGVPSYLECAASKTKKGCKNRNGYG